MASYHRRGAFHPSVQVYNLLVRIGLLHFAVTVIALMQPSSAFQCFDFDPDPKKESPARNKHPPDQVMEQCVPQLESCMAVLSKEQLLKDNAHLVNLTRSSAQYASISVSDEAVVVTNKSIMYQGCFFEQCKNIDLSSGRCELATNAFREKNLVCCCNGRSGCNQVTNIMIRTSYLIPVQPYPPKESDGRLGNLGRILLFSLVPATIIGVLAVLTYLFTSCKYSKILHLLTSDRAHMVRSSRMGTPRLNPQDARQSVTRGAGCSGEGVLLSEDQKFLRSIDLSMCPLIGQGKFGQVYRLEANFMGEKDVAIKVFYLSDRCSWLKEVEIYSIKSVQEHRGILKFLAAEDLGSEGGGCWLVTEYHALGSVYDYLKTHNAISPQALLRIAESFFSGLAFLHDGFNGGIRIAHRDIKSRNILLKKDLNCCIADFGLAMELRPDQEIGCTHSQVGTRRYMAPEVLEGAIIFTAEAFLRIDVYAASLVLWELLNCCTCLESTRYKVPFEVELGPAPSADEINVFVAERRLRPHIPDKCRVHPMLSLLCETTEECWDQDCEARLSAVCVQQRLHRLIQQFRQLSRCSKSSTTGQHLNPDHIPELALVNGAASAMTSQCHVMVGTVQGDVLALESVGGGGGNNKAEHSSVDTAEQCRRTGEEEEAIHNSSV